MKHPTAAGSGSGTLSIVKEQELVVYTDGAHRGDGSKAVSVWAYLIAGTGRRDFGMLKSKECTSNRAEQKAILHALEATVACPRITIYSDSKSCVDVVENWLLNGKRPRPASGQQFLDEYLAATAGREVTLAWLPGHKGHYGNTQVDHLARAALRYAWARHRVVHREIYAVYDSNHKNSATATCPPCSRLCESL